MGEAERQGVAEFQVMRRKCCESYNLLRRQNVVTSNAGGSCRPVRCTRETARLHGCHVDIRSSSDRQRVNDSGRGSTPACAALEWKICQKHIVFCVRADSRRERMWSADTFVFTWTANIYLF